MPNVSETRLGIDGRLSVEYSGGTSNTIDLTSAIVKIPDQVNLSSLRTNYPAQLYPGQSAIAGDSIYDSVKGNWTLRGSSYGLPVYSWKDRPDPTQYVGDFFIRDIGVRHSRWTSDGLQLSPAGGNPICLDAQMFDVAFIDDKTTEQVLYEYHIPPGLLRENWSIELTTKCTFPAFASAVTRSLRLYFGSAQLAATNNGASTGLVTTKWHGMTIDNKNSFGAQLGEANGYAGVAAQQSAVPFTTTTADTQSKYVTLQLRGIITTLGAGTMSNTLHEARLMLIPGI